MLIVSAGMPRSGSTWMYNAIRVMVTGPHGIDEPITCGWVDDIAGRIGQESCLVKVHTYDRAMADAADHVFYSYRDLRDTMASQKRSFDREPTIEEARFFVENDARWREKAVVVMRYESFTADPMPVLAAIAAALPVDGAAIDLREVKAELETLSYQSAGSKNETYNSTNLFHKGHVTDGRHGSWRDTLPPEFVVELEGEFGGWLQAHGYELS